MAWPGALLFALLLACGSVASVSGHEGSHAGEKSCALIATFSARTRLGSVASNTLPINPPRICDPKKGLKKGCLQPLYRLAYAFFRAAWAGRRLPCVDLTLAYSDPYYNRAPPVYFPKKLGVVTAGGLLIVESKQRESALAALARVWSLQKTKTFLKQLGTYSLNQDKPGTDPMEDEFNYYYPRSPAEADRFLEKADLVEACDLDTVRILKQARHYWPVAIAVREEIGQAPPALIINGIIAAALTQAGADDATIIGFQKAAASFTVGLSEDFGNEDRVAACAGLADSLLPTLLEIAQVTPANMFAKCTPTTTIESLLPHGRRLRGKGSYGRGVCERDASELISEFAEGLEMIDREPERGRRPLCLFASKEYTEMDKVFKIANDYLQDSNFVETLFILAQNPDAQTTEFLTTKVLPLQVGFALCASGFTGGIRAAKPVAFRPLSGR